MPSAAVVFTSAARQLRKIYSHVLYYNISACFSLIIFLKMRVVGDISKSELYKMLTNHIFIGVLVFTITLLCDFLQSKRLGFENATSSPSLVYKISFS